MNRSRLLSLTIVTLCSLFLVVLALFSAAQAAARAPDSLASAALAPEAQSTSAELTVTIRTSPYAPLDSNNPADPNKLHVVVLQAEVENTGLATATDVDLIVDYDDPPGWTLLEGESSVRSLGTLEPGAFGYAYWFATYPVPGSSETSLTHTYAVTATAANATAASTSKNAYGEPLPPGATIETDAFGYLETGSTPTISTTGNVGVGSIFTTTVTQYLGNNPTSVILSPVGNLSFDASTMQLVDVDVVITGTSSSAAWPNQVYIPQVPAALGKEITAKVSYAFLPQRPGQVILCPYAAVTGPVNKYDKNFCTGDNKVVIDASLDLAFNATVDRLQVQQGELLNYTLTYTNNGALGITNAWFWSDLDPAVGSLVPATMNPAGNTSQTTTARAAWSVAEIGPGASGTLNFQVLLDGAGTDIPDGTELVVANYFGIELGDNLPTSPALTETLTSTVQAPSLAIAKSDGELTAEPFAPLTYEVHVTNTGSIPAESVIITDTLPAGVTYTGGADVLVWHDQTPIGPGDSVSLEIPVTVDASVPDGTVLANTATVGYGNGAGYRFDQVSADDETMVNAPVLSIAKSAGADSVLTARPLTYTLTYTNDGPAPATNVVVTDVVPTGSTYVGCSGSDCLEAGNTVTWTVGTVPANSVGSVTLTVVVDTTLATGSVLVNDHYGLVSDQSGFIAGPSVSTTVFRNAAIFDGYAFVDANADGVFDAGELPLPGVTLTLPAAVTSTDISAADGSYAFRVEQEGPVTVSADLPAGYFRTSVGSVPAYASFGITQTINFGYAPLETAVATISGIVFDDVNGSGSLDAGELGIPGVTITLDGLTGTTTDLLGRYTLATNADGFHTIVETDPAGYVSTTPNSVNVDVETGNNYQVDFGDMVDTGSVAVIHGTVFEDTDGNGLQGPDEPGIADVEITLDGTFTTTTGAYGAYTFATAAGNHTVVETDPAGYLSTTPNSVNVQVSAGASARVDFGDVADAAFAVIYGTVFDDADGDGLRDPGELGLAAVEVTLDGTLSTTTNANGNYSFAAAAGTHTVVETDPAGYISTTPNGVNLDVLAGNTYQVDFGDKLGSGVEAIIHGTVFADADADGIQDPGELGLAGVELTLDGTLTTTTNGWGGYTFPATVGEIHTVVETDPAGYVSTTPNSVNVDVGASSSYQVDFGDILATASRSAIFGTVFHDANRDGIRAAAETGLSGVTITVDEAVQVTDAYGRYTFSITAAGSYTVVETDPPGYASSTANEVTVALTLDNSQQVDFGDYLLCDADAYEEDDSFAGASAITPGSRQERNFCDDAVDWLAVEATAGREYRFTTTASGLRTDTVLTLFAADGTTALAGNDDYEGASDFSSRIVWIAPEDGTYLLRVHNRAGLSGFATDYALSLAETGDDTRHLYLPLVRTSPQSALHPLPSRHLRLAAPGDGADRGPAAPDGQIVHACPDPYEVDDHWSLARPLVSGAVEVHSFDSDTTLYAADKDFFRIDLAPLATFSVSVAPVPGTGTRLELYDENGNMLDVAGSTALSFAGPSGRYYLGVAPTGDAFGCAAEAGYTLEAHFTGNQLYLPYVSTVAAP